jgi:hypothetical protein
MDSKITAWKATLSEKERRLHELAAIKLKKTLVPKDCKTGDKDNGSYYVDKCHAFQAWLKTQTSS